MINTTRNGYSIDSIFYQDSLNIYYIVSKTNKSNKYFLKLPRSTTQIKENILGLRHEYEISQLLNYDGILMAKELIHFKNQNGLILEYFHGEFLIKVIESQKLSIMESLEIVIKLTDTLLYIHSQNIIHKNINPRNIIWDQKRKKIKLGGMELSSVISNETTQYTNLFLTDSPLEYISPEQTGRMNRNIDIRSDFYSIGIIMYQLLTGILPFYSRDMLEIMYSHIAHIPLAPNEVNSEIPTMLSNMVMKLLEKSPEKRYQTAKGLLSDLGRCFAQLLSKNSIDEFTLGKSDYQRNFSISTQKLYGRELDIEKLIEIFKKASSGSNELVLISGYSGVGKTAIVNEVHEILTKNSGIFISGKFDQYNKNIPYSAFCQAFAQLIKQIITESPEVFDSWSNKISQALMENSRIIIDVIPELELLVTKRGETLVLPPKEAHNRFLLTFKKFILLFAKEEHPLFIFLDDMQWADLASIDLMKAISSDPNLKNIILVGSYRDNEVHATHPLIIATKEMEKNNHRINHIHIKSLSLENIMELLIYTCNRPMNEIEGLAKLLKDKTDGNPFFLNQLLIELFHRNLIYLNDNLTRLEWDISELKIIEISNNVVDLMITKIFELPQDTRENLQICSCIGSDFDLQTLSFVTEESFTKLVASLWPAVIAGLIIPSNNDSIEFQHFAELIKDEVTSSLSKTTLKFLHDRVQQAAYATISPDNKSILHNKIASLLIKNASLETIEEKLFEIVNHLNKGSDQFLAKNSKIDLINFNLRAGIKARTAVAYGPANEYFQSGLALIDENIWQSNYDEVYTLSIEHAECEYFLANIDEAQRLLYILLERCNKEIDKGKIYKILVDLHTTKGEISRAIECGITGVSLFGVELYLHPTRDQVITTYTKIVELMDDRPIESLINLPAMNNPQIEVALSILATMMPPALFFDENLLYLEHIKMVELSLIYGNAAPSCHGYSYFGMILGSLFNKFDDAYKFGKLGYDLMNKFDFQIYKAKVCLSFGSNVNFWVNHVKTNLPYLEEGYKGALAVGDITYSCYHCNHISMALLASGAPLIEVYKDTLHRRKYVEKTTYREIVDILISKERLMLTLMGRTNNHFTFSDESFDEANFEKHLENNMPLTVCWYYIHKLQARYMFGMIDEALQAAACANNLLWSTVAHVELPEFYLYYSLSLAAKYPKLEKKKQTETLEILKDNLNILEIWSNSCKDNFYHKYALVKAELEKIQGNSLEAIRFYQEAINSSKEFGFIQNEGLANELAASFYHQLGITTASSAHVMAALINYNKWNADGKVEYLKSLFPEIQNDLSYNCYFNSIPSNSSIDNKTIMKYVNALSLELDLESFMSKLMFLIIENAGAQRGGIILENEANFLIESYCGLSENFQNETTLQTQYNPYFSLSIVRYVLRTGKSVLLDKASSSINFKDDEYIKNFHKKSILCTPIHYQGRIKRVLYIENNLVAGAFTSNTIEFLNLILPQASISLENAKLFEAQISIQSKLEESEARWKFALEGAGDGVWDWNPQTNEGFLSSQFSSMLGYSVDEIKGNTNDLAKLVHPEDLDKMANLLKCYVLGESTLYLSEYRILCKDNSYKWVLSRGKTVERDLKGNAKRIIGTHTDISDRKAYEEKIQFANEELERKVLERTKKLEIAKDDMQSFAYFVSHDLRSPLRSIKGFSEAIIEDYNQFLDIQGIDYTNRILLNISKMEKLIDEIFRLSIISNKEINLQRINLSAIAREKFDLLLESPIPKAKEIVTNFENNIIVNADREFLGILLNSLFENALKYSSKNQAAARIELGQTTIDGLDVYYIKDNGIGFNNENAPKMFAMFQRLHSSSQFPGTGVGLSIAMRIINKHGGRIWAESQVGNGATFYFTLSSE